MSLTCRYLSCRAADDSAITSEASFSALDAFFSPSAAMICKKGHHVVGCCVKETGFPLLLTLALASLAASASAAMALCSCTGKRASLLEVKQQR